MNYCLEADSRKQKNSAHGTFDLSNWPWHWSTNSDSVFFSWWVEWIQIPQKAKCHLNGVSLADLWCSNIECRLGSFMIFVGGVLDPCPSGSEHTEQYETLVLHVFSLRYARARYILRNKPMTSSVIQAWPISHPSGYGMQWARNGSRLTPGLTSMTPCPTADLNLCKRWKWTKYKT